MMGHALGYVLEITGNTLVVHPKEHSMVVAGMRLKLASACHENRHGCVQVRSVRTVGTALVVECEDHVTTGIPAAARGDFVSVAAVEDVLGVSADELRRTLGPAGPTVTMLELREVVALCREAGISELRWRDLALSLGPLVTTEPERIAEESAPADTTFDAAGFVPKDLREVRKEAKRAASTD